MSTPPKPDLHINVSNLGPVAKLDGYLSKGPRNLIYARNGTGKSFLTRALHYLDLHTQGGDLTDAARNLVSEESVDGTGSFTISQGASPIASIALNVKTGDVRVSKNDLIFHVFSEEFVHAELRQSEFAIDGNIETEIALDQTNIDTKAAESKVEEAQKEFNGARIQLQSDLETQKVEELSIKAAVNKRLKDYMEISLDALLAVHKTQPEMPERILKDLLTDLDALKAIPAEPNYPENVRELAVNLADIEFIHTVLEKITSPSTVSEDIKAKIASNPEFFEKGSDLYVKDGKSHCPFCDQSTEEKKIHDRISAYLGYFADAEGRHKKELKEAWLKIKALKENLGSYSVFISQQALKFDALKKYLPSRRDLELPDLTHHFEEINSAFARYYEVIGTKGKNPSSTVVIPAIDLSALYQRLYKDIEVANLLISNLNAAILASDSERKTLQRDCCAAFSTEFFHSNWAAVSNMHELGVNLDNAGDELKALKASQLSASVKERVANTFEILIATFFDKKYTFDKDRFVLKRDNKDMHRGPSRTLSEGEKTAIAFCYFVACTHKKVKNTSDYAKLFFVFDDPITSMSYDFVFSIAQTLKNLSLSDKGEISINPSDIQAGFHRPDLIVFTHSSYFYNICVTNRVVEEKQAAFFLHKINDEHKLSKHSRYVAPFEHYLQEVFDVHNGRDPQPTTCNAVRCVLEAVGRFCHPHKCDNLSNYITFLAGEGFEIKSVLINNLSHGSYYDETPSPEEIKEACDEIIAIVEKYAIGQLEIVRTLAVASQAKKISAVA